MFVHLLIINLATKHAKVTSAQKGHLIYECKKLSLNEWILFLYSKLPFTGLALYNEGSHICLFYMYTTNNILTRTKVVCEALSCALILSRISARDLGSVPKRALTPLIYFFPNAVWARLLPERVVFVLYSKVVVVDGGVGRSHSHTAFRVKADFCFDISFNR